MIDGVNVEIESVVIPDSDPPVLMIKISRDKFNATVDVFLTGEDAELLTRTIAIIGNADRILTGLTETRTI